MLCCHYCFFILNAINCYKDNVHVFFVIECYINMFTVVSDGECSESRGNGTEHSRVKRSRVKRSGVKCHYCHEFDVYLDCVSYRQCTGKYDKYQHDNL